MKTTLDILLILYKVVSSTASITSTITGGIYKEQRPMNSDKEDVVIICDNITCEQLQSCKPVIKIHVPNKPIFINGNQDLSQPDSERIKELTGLVWDAIGFTQNEKYWFYVDTQSTEAEANEHYSNITINFNYLNTN